MTEAKCKVLAATIDDVKEKVYDAVIGVCCLCTELHDAIFVIGAVDEMLVLRGMRYHPIDIENSIVRSHRNICEWFVIQQLNSFIS